MPDTGHEAASEGNLTKDDDVVQPSSWSHRLWKVQNWLPRTLSSGIAYLAGGEVLNLLLSLCSFVLLTRLLGRSGYGVWVTVLDAAAILLGLAAFGLPLATVQAIAAEGGDIYIWPALLLRLLSVVVIGAVALSVVLFSSGRARYGWPVLLVTPGFLASGLIDASKEALQATHCFRRAALLDSVARSSLVLVLVVLWLTTRLGAPVEPRLLVTLAAWSVTCCLALLAAFRTLRPGRLAPFGATWRAVRHLGRAAPVLSAITLTGILRFKVEVVLLGALRSSAEAGEFAVATRLIAIALIVPKIVVAVLFPYLVRARHEPAADADRHAGRLVALVAIAGLALSVVSALVLPPVISLTAGHSYGHAVTAGRMLSLLIAPTYLSTVLTILLVERGRQQLAASLSLLPALVAYGIEFALVRRYGQAICVASAGGAVLVSCVGLIIACGHLRILSLPYSRVPVV